MNRIIQKLTQLLPKNEVLYWQSRLEQIQDMPGKSLKFRRIANAPDREQLYDSLAEVRYALVFKSLGFQVRLEPSGEKGSDLEVFRDGNSAIVEVRRFRQVDEEPPCVSFDCKNLSDDFLTLEPYGNPERDIKKFIDRIVEKFKQVRDCESIIAIWNDDEKDRETEFAISELRNYSNQGLSVPPGLLFVLYGSDWQRPRQQFHCFPLRKLGLPHENWMRELENFLIYLL